MQWASSEAFRRASPNFVAAQFGVRSKPKPFTGVAVFDNPDEVNPLPAVDDLPGSALDAQKIALYVWLAAYRYEEYRAFHRVRLRCGKPLRGLPGRAAGVCPRAGNAASDD